VPLPTLIPLVLAAAAQVANTAPEEVPLRPTPPLKVLVYTCSAGFEHEVVRRPKPGAEHGAETGTGPERGTDSLVERVLRNLAERTPDIAVVVSRDTSWFDPERLARLDVVLFFTTGELPLSEGRRHALLDWVRAGGAFVGVHSATDTLYQFPAYGEMIGGTFDGHPWHQRVRILVEDKQHLSTAHLGAAFEITDEIYQFRAPDDQGDRGRLHVLLRLDTAGLDLELPAVRRKAEDFALAWCRPYGEGRVFYTALGHRPDVWRDERFLGHLVGGIRWAARRAPPEAAIPE